jgi:hypothetical protein
MPRNVASQSQNSLMLTARQNRGHFFTWSPGGRHTLQSPGQAPLLLPAGVGKVLPALDACGVIET